jgi:hypothetical protein
MLRFPFVPADISGSARHVVGGLGLSLARHATCAGISSLSQAQLRDAGIDRAATCGNRPTLPIDSALMANLMSLQ